MEDILITMFNEKFGCNPLVVRSPGRINIIGEHTDYNQGFVLPAAIDKDILIAIAKRDDDKIHLVSEAYKDEHITTIKEVSPCDKMWANYLLGVTAQLIKKDLPLGGFNIILGGNVPIGAGLSSSAAIECAALFALNEIFSLSIERVDMVKMAQTAEHEYIGVRCGIMDMFASMLGKKNYAIKLDCRSHESEFIPLELHNIDILLLNTNVKHSLASSEYNTRRADCEQGVAWVQQHHSEVTSLRDVDTTMLDKYVKSRNKIIYKRCRFVVEENKRLLKCCDYLKAGNIAALGAQMYTTHKGLSKDYDVSCSELDFLVDYAKNSGDVLGARMMGGGFGGCTINLISKEKTKPFADIIATHYQHSMHHSLTAYVVSIEDGTSICKRPN